MSYCRSSSSMERSSNGTERKCLHKIPGIMKTSHTEKNPERRYVECRRRDFDDCGFWVWVDPELTPYYKSCFNKMRSERDAALNNYSGFVEGFEGDGVEASMVKIEALPSSVDVKLQVMERRIRTLTLALIAVIILFLYSKL